MQTAREVIQGKQNQAYSFTLTSTNLATGQNAPILPAFNKETPTKILACMNHAQLFNIADPGRYHSELNKVLEANSLQTIIIPDIPNSKEKINHNMSPSDFPSPSKNEELVSNAHPSTSLQEQVDLGSQGQTDFDYLEQANVDTETESEEANNSENESSTDSDSVNHAEENLASEATEQTKSQQPYKLPPKPGNKGSVPTKYSGKSKRNICTAARVFPSPVSSHIRKTKDSTSCKQKLIN